MEQNDIQNELNKDLEKKDVKFVSFSEKDTNGKVRETYGYWEKSDIADVLRKLQEEKEIKEQGGKVK